MSEHHHLYGRDACPHEDCVAKFSKPMLKILPARRSGRTTRMIQEAEHLAHRGVAVYVVFATKEQGEAYKTDKHDALGIKFETFSSLPNLNLRTLELRGSRNCVVLIDHFAIEDHFGKLIEEMHRWDYQ